MKKVLSALLLALTATIVQAQSLAYGMTVGNLQATRNTTTGLSTITGTIANQGQESARRVRVTFALYDAQGKEIGTVSSSTNDLAPGEVWHVHVDTPLQFVRFSARDVATD